MIFLSAYTKNMQELCLNLYQGACWSQRDNIKNTATIVPRENFTK